MAEPISLKDVPGVGPATASKLRQAGITTIEALAVSPVREIVEKTDLGFEKALKIIREARKLVHVDWVTAVLGLEDLLSQESKIRVLRVLALRGELNICRIMRETGLSWGRLDRMLRKFVQRGILRECRYSCSRDRYIRTFRYADTPQARILKRLFQEWENLTLQSRGDDFL